MTRDTLLEGGPFHGCVVFATSDRPIVMFDEPRQPNLLESEKVAVMPVAVWDEKRRWYEPEG